MSLEVTVTWAESDQLHSPTTAAPTNRFILQTFLSLALHRRQQVKLGSAFRSLLACLAQTIIEMRPKHKHPPRPDGNPHCGLRVLERPVYR